MSAFFGFIAFVVALFAVGAFMEGNIRRAGLFAAAFVACGVVIVAFDRPRAISLASDCFTEWDGRTSRTVCQ